MTATDPRCARLSDLSECAYRLGLAFGREAEQAGDTARTLEYFRLFDRCFFAVRVATALELRLQRTPAAGEAFADRDDDRALSANALRTPGSGTATRSARPSAPACRCCCAPCTTSSLTRWRCRGRSRRLCRPCVNSWRMWRRRRVRNHLPRRPAPTCAAVSPAPPPP
jgi:hypothetical protein